MINLKNDIDAYMDKNNINANVLSGKIGVSRMQLYRWMKGESIPNRLAWMRLKELKITKITLMCNACGQEIK